jgi:hypothetical protein
VTGRTLASRLQPPSRLRLSSSNFRGGGGLLFNRANFFTATAPRATARSNFSTRKNFSISKVCRDISSSRRDQSDVDGAAISRTSSIDVAKKTLIELDQQNGMLKVIDDDSGVALNRVRHHQ